ncbi:hypothetical protein Y11_16661 [Yersinia enterocolitica subsp. palearctica Y11]|uniref:Uncharacterized protein n=1 Tax=Yersinia enterocolitica subsp. palearctica serotype O:3 (strain DSM 13030 / CIP 106945 / Y11) TaxID=930944 RepID=A0A0H3NN59_YERE1|nr:hypothetical protein Y11_16661 [Yersinia enterocolitica subsp. palearctica Y11]
MVGAICKGTVKQAGLSCSFWGYWLILRFSLMGHFVKELNIVNCQQSEHR